MVFRPMSSYTDRNICNRNCNYHHHHHHQYTNTMNGTSCTTYSYEGYTMGFLLLIIICTYRHTYIHTCIHTYVRKIIRARVERLYLCMDVCVSTYCSLEKRISVATTVLCFQFKNSRSAGGVPLEKNTNLFYNL